MHHDYAHALAVATQAALAAGELLRAEQSRPDGPRGHGDHADVDDVAEILIRTHLMAATPWDFRGEETGRHAGSASDAEHLWLVDPNDGTRAYLRGWRGPAVSIALLCDGVPVLGVVYAPTAPDHAGDLFTWAQGCGPLRRNGKVAHRSLFTNSLTRTDVVVVSQDADNSPADNAGLVAPARYLPVASIAYRLALVAAGDGVAAISLNGPGGWDVAAGHALLRSVGGDLVNELGLPVTYSRDGTAHTRHCFGGGLAVVQELAARPWHKLRRHTTPTEPWDLASLRPGDLIADVGILQRAQGCLLGQAAGDALGSLVEFRPAAEIARIYPEFPRTLQDGGAWNTLAGQPTDDTELAWMLARSLVQTGTFDRHVTARAYRFWHDSRPFDMGATTRRALGAIPKDDASAADYAQEAADPDSQANGALMRVSPLGIWGHALPPGQLAEHARADARLTHPHQVCQDASAVFAVSLAQAIAKPHTPRQLYDFALAWAIQAGVHEYILTLLRAAELAPPADYQSHMGWVRTAFQNAWFQLLHAPDAVTAVVDTVRRGGDSDTNGAIVGALVGAVYGREGLPLQWRTAVLTCRPLRATDFGFPAIPVHKPRPRQFWPVDVLVLAERLLRAGQQ